MQCGTNYRAQLGNGNRLNIYQLTEQSHLNNCKYISTNGVGTIFIDSNDILYCCGQWYKNANETEYIINPQKIEENVKEAEITGLQETIYIITKNGEILKYVYFNKINIENLKDTNATFLYGQFVLSNDKINVIGTATTATNASIWYEGLKNIEKIANEEYLYGNNKNLLAFKANGKIYVQFGPDITKIKEKSNYELRTLMNDAIFVNGNGIYISIVDKSGNVYEQIGTKSAISNVKKIIASSGQKFIITNDKHIYAKGDGVGGMWGDTEYKANYVELKDENGKTFDNVKNVFTSTEGRTAIFQTEDNEIYFGGNINYISLPRNNRRFKTF